MADAFGMITLSKSDGCVANEAAIVDILNNYEWNCSGEPWELDASSGVIFINSRSLEYPTLSPSKIDHYILDRGDGEIEVKPEMVTFDDHDAICEVVMVDVDSDEIVNRISPLIRDGEIRMVCTYHLNARYTGFEELTIKTQCNGSFRKVQNHTSGQYFEYTERVFSGILC